jgi:hypothetical protein
MATVKKAAKKGAAEKGGAKKGAAKKSGNKSQLPVKSETKNKKEESEPEMLARRSKESAEHTSQVRSEIELPPSYQFNTNEQDPERSSEIERHKAQMANRERYNKEAENQIEGDRMPKEY